ncbi:thyroid receptor-interacting protein 11-like isoform X1 [Onthophagus taurus]|uniref:thyroid receptor-interacting protein 11-like isoform X1 n=2 Tax=Onthophagus taurus TaxID=166361 RepID=UPI0039BE63D5
MSWLNFNDSLTNLRGQLSNLASGVLSDGLVNEPGEDGKKDDRLEELEKLIVSQENEIRELRKLNKEFQEKSVNNPLSNVETSNYDSSSNEWNWETDVKNPNEDIICNLKYQITELENEKKDLIVSLEQLDLDCQQTTEKVINLKDALQVEYNNLQEKYDILNQDYKKIKNSKNDDEKEVLKKKILDYESKIENYQAGRISDQEEYDKLAKILQGYEDHVKMYKEKCIKLESEINMSKVNSNDTNNDVDLSLLLNDTFKKFMDYPLPVETNTFTSTVEEIMKHLLEYKYKTDTLEKQVSSLLDEKSSILKEKNEEIEKLLNNSELLSQEIIYKNDALKHYEEERRELIKNNDILISELDDIRNNSGLHTISETNEDNLIILENQLEMSHSKNEELEKELNENKKQLNIVKNDYETLFSDYEKIKDVNLSDEGKFSEINMETLKEEIENLQIQIDTLIKKNKKYEHDNLKYQGEIEIGQTEIEDLKQTLSVELETREGLENEIRFLKEKLQKIKMSETTLKLQYDRDLQTLNETNLKLEEVTKSYNEVQEIVEKLNFERAEFNIHNKMLEEEHVKLTQQLKEEIKYLKELIDKNECENEKNIFENHEVLEKLKFEYEELKIDYKTLKDENEKFKTLSINDCDELKEKLLNYQASIDLIKNENEKINFEFSVLNEKHKNLEDEYKKMQDEITSKNEIITKYQNDIEKLKEENRTLLVSNNQNKEKLGEAEKINLKFTSLNEEYKNLKEICENLKMQLQNTETKNAKLEIEENLLDNIKKEAETKISNLQEELNVTKTNYTEKIKILETTLSELIENNNNLRTSLTAKHEESHQYYIEIQRLNQILSVEVEKTKKLSEEIKKPTEISQNQELLIKINTLTEEIEKLSEQNSFLKSKCDVLGQTLLEEQQNSKKIIDELSNSTSEKEISLSKELQRLRAHLLEIEDQHMQEIMLADKKATEMQTKMMILEQREKQATSLHTSVNIRTNQHVETLQNQLQLVTNQRDELRKKVSDAEDTINKQSAGLANLEFVLRQFQDDKEKGVQLETERIRRQIMVEKNVQENLKKELTCLKNQLDESKQGLLAASRLSDQMETSKHQIVVLKEENDKLREKLRKTEENQNASGSQETKVDKMLVKNLVVGFITSNNITLNKDQHQILKIISTVLDFNQQDNEKVKLNKNNQGSWLGAILHPNVLSQNQGMSQESLSQAFVRFLENESTPRQLPKLLNPDLPLEQPGTPQPLLLNEVVLPTFADFGQNRNSSSILKDVLKDNN